MVEDREFTIYTDQKPLTLDFTSQFSTDIRYIKGNENVVVDALSGIEIDGMSNEILNFHEMSLTQLNDLELQKSLNS